MPIGDQPEIEPREGAEDESDKEDRDCDEPSHDSEDCSRHSSSPRTRWKAPAKAALISPDGSDRHSRFRCSATQSYSFLECRMPNVGSQRSGNISCSNSP